MTGSYYILGKNTSFFGRKYYPWRIIVFTRECCVKVRVTTVLIGTSTSNE